MEIQSMEVILNGREKGGIPGFVYIMDYDKKTVVDGSEKVEKKEVVVFGGIAGEPIKVQGYELRREPEGSGTTYTVQQITEECSTSMCSRSASRRGRAIPAHPGFLLTGLKTFLQCTVSLRTRTQSRRFHRENNIPSGLRVRSFTNRSS